ncbi:MAG: hypothetical protein A2X28_01610 [Elusimicrobia bacterium GWA2_56_46]|nr:MAG: hypothetical protein A2X28_01610 [Elusimicrobia bacterium GWA2_56_46]OGR53854.1 MAG: hypothetical protein A2X39_07010 [Elusimicrobia bacterium GWC2_56_31]HBB68325.1 hypothetical protein [Elusimicrobiota bacterium]HBW22706.1 hypothetical protein [Elusimicrobiota bacterium]
MKIFSNLLIALTLFTSPALAAEAGKPAKQPAKAVKKGTLKPNAAAKPAVPQKNIPGTAGSEEKELETRAVSGLKDWDAKLQTLRTRFTQEVDFSDAGIKQHIEGILSYIKPDLLKIEHIKPARQLVYTDKKELWVYKPEDSQAVRTSWDAWKTNQSSNFSGIMDLGNYAGLTARNNLRVSKNKAAPYHIKMIFTPKNDPGLYTLELALSSTDYFPAEAALTVDKTTIKTVLESPERNITLDKALFRFVPPKGTEVLEFKN